MRSPSERAVILVIGAVQFINILDFMMVAPLGPFFAKGLAIPPSQVALVTASYTLSASVAGLLGSLFLDRYDRRIALLLALSGLMVGTILGGFAQGLHSLLATRLLAGFFGGPATSLSISIVSDLIPPGRRGRAMGAVMSAFSVASVVGIPLGLILAEHGGWRLPFFVVGGCGFLLTAVAARVLPPMRDHLAAARSQEVWGSVWRLARQGLVRTSWSMTGLAMLGGFLLVPNFPVYLTRNLGFPLKDIKLLYLGSGAISFLVLRVGGKLVDRYGSFRVGSVASFFLLGVVFFYTVHVIPGTPVPLLFVAFTAAMGFRNISVTTLASKVPKPAERARFQSVQSAVQHAASALGGGVSAWILSTDAAGALRHMDWVGSLSMLCTALLPILLFRVERLIPPAISMPAQVADSR